MEEKKMVFVKAFIAVLILSAYFAGMFEGHAGNGGPSRVASTEIIAKY
ncbi:MAG: hypothetical protein AAGF14_00390 [Pseudomonadota bacterium]